MKECKVFLKPKKEESLLRFHPWVFSGAIQTIEGEPEEGDLVEVYGTNGRFLGIGHYQIGSIAVRILSFKPVTIDAAFWEERIRIAYTLRQTLELAPKCQLVLNPEVKSIFDFTIDDIKIENYQSHGRLVGKVSV